MHPVMLRVAAGKAPSGARMLRAASSGDTPPVAAPRRSDLPFWVTQNGTCGSPSKNSCVSPLSQLRGGTAGVYLGPGARWHCIDWHTLSLSGLW